MSNHNGDWRTPAEPPSHGQVIEFFTKRHDTMCVGCFNEWEPHVWKDLADTDSDGFSQQYATGEIYCWRPAPTKPVLP